MMSKEQSDAGNKVTHVAAILVGIVAMVICFNLVSDRARAEFKDRSAVDERSSSTLYINNPDCIVDGRAGRDTDIVLSLHHPEKFSPGCFRPPLPTAEDAKSPLIGQKVLFGPTGQIMEGTIVQYIDSSKEVVVKRDYDSKMVRLGSSGIEVKGPLHDVVDMKVLSMSPDGGRSAHAVALVTRKDGSKSKCTFDMTVDLINQELRSVSRHYVCSPIK